MKLRESTTGSLPGWAPSLLVAFAVCQIAQSCQASKADTTAHSPPKAGSPTAQAAEPAQPAAVLTTEIQREREPLAPAKSSAKVAKL
jgi:hypothetical protein